MIERTFQNIPDGKLGEADQQSPERIMVEIETLDVRKVLISLHIVLYIC